ncbi:MAG: MBL fold metallo-hydrolase [Rhodobacteraceae bacterium]|nr:MBL fold metallo-hydrolase [Paracoccaceae bacterium]
MFNTEHTPEIGVAKKLTDGLLVVTAPNASPMTFTGTQSYILGDSEVAVIDPGPNDPAHFEALKRAIAGRPVSHVLVTHSHIDHSPLAQAFEAPVLAFGPSGAGMSEVMQGLVELDGGEGIDRDFKPDQLLADGDIVTGAGWAVEAVHTPGHMSNHLCFAFEGGLLSGDHVMAWSTTLVSPPDGDLTQFMASLRKLQARNDTRYFPGHGPVLEDPQAMLAYQIAHRQARETQILEALPGKISDITTAVYSDLDSRLLPMAARNVFSHLIDLCQRGKVLCNGPIRFDGRFELVD